MFVSQPRIAEQLKRGLPVPKRKAMLPCKVGETADPQDIEELLLDELRFGSSDEESDKEAFESVVGNRDTDLEGGHLDLTEDAMESAVTAWYAHVSEGVAALKPCAEATDAVARKSQPHWHVWPHRSCAFWQCRCASHRLCELDTATRTPQDEMSSG